MQQLNELRTIFSDMQHRPVPHRPWPLPRWPWIMRQSWHDVLFAHWPIPVDQLRPAVPPPLPIDTFKGTAWLGIVSFEVRGLRARGAPGIPGASNFLELNVRTYTTVHGKPGVYFFSLDAASALAVFGARLGFVLPYFQANMALQRRGPEIHFRSRRLIRTPAPAEFTARYQPVGAVFNAAPGSLDAFLTERYCLYVVDNQGRVYRTEINHQPWPLQRAEAELTTNTMTQQIGVTLPVVAPALHYASQQDVAVWLLRQAHR
jgi:uncharacterized protein